MALNGITDICATVSVPKPEYEELIRESNTLHILENIVSAQKYVDADTLRNILGIKSNESEGEE